MFIDYFWRAYKVKKIFDDMKEYSWYISKLCKYNGFFYKYKKIRKFGINIETVINIKKYKIYPTCLGSILTNTLDNTLHSKYLTNNTRCLYHYLGLQI